VLVDGRNVVAVEKVDELAARFAQSPVPRRTRSGVRLPDDLELRNSGISCQLTTEN